MDTIGFQVQFIPMLVNNNLTPNPAWDGNMSLSSLESAPVLSVVGDTSVMVCKIIEINFKKIKSLNRSRDHNKKVRKQVYS